MSKHTPGPWFVEDNDRAISSNAATDIALVNMANIRYGWDGPDFLTASHRAANARLIAAAPELLYALQEFVRTMESLPESDETNLRVWDMYRMAQAAIKKAGGDA